MSPETFICEPEDHKIQLIGINSTVDPVRLMTDCIICHMVPGYRYVSFAKIWEWLEEGHQHPWGCTCGRCDADGFTDGSHAGSPHDA